MKLGLFSMPLHRPEKPFLQTLEEDREAILLADRLGYSEAWIGEHFTSKVEQIASPLIFLATLIHETRSIRFGTGVINIPHHHPVTVASHVALFDQLSEGRFLFGIGPGGLVSDAEMYGHHDPAERQRMMLAAIDIVLELWRGEPPYRFENEWWDIAIDEAVYPRHGVGLISKPYQDPHPPVAMAMVSANSGSAGVCGGRGWIPISANFIPSRDVATHWPLYAEAAEKAGRPADPSVWRVARNLLVTESEAQARDILADPDGLFHFYFPLSAQPAPAAGGEGDRGCARRRAERIARRGGSRRRNPDLRHGGDGARPAGRAARGNRPVRHASHRHARLGGPGTLPRLHARPRRGCPAGLLAALRSAGRAGLTPPPAPVATEQALGIGFRPG